MMARTGRDARRSGTRPPADLQETRSEKRKRKATGEG
jgi:hypothetical protein